MGTTGSFYPTCGGTVIDVGNYMIGEFLSVVAGLAIGAIIVGICWATANTRVDKALNQSNWDAKGELEAAKAKMIRKSLKREEARTIAAPGS
jgi:hypothetical protein